MNKLSTYLGDARAREGDDHSHNVHSQLELKEEKGKDLLVVQKDL